MSMTITVKDRRRSTILGLNPADFWEFSEVDGTTITDYGSGAHHGTVHGGVTLGIMTSLGRMAKFDGATGYVSLPSVAASTTTYTTMVAFTPNGLSPDGALFSSTGGIIAHFFTPNNYLFNDGSNHVGSTVLTPGMAYLWFMVVSGASATLKIFGPNVFGNDGTFGSASSWTPTSVGCYGAGASNFTACMVGQVAYWPGVALSDGNISNIVSGDPINVRDLSITYTAGAMATLSATVDSEDRSYRPTPGGEISVRRIGSDIYAGIMQYVDEGQLGVSGIRQPLQALDYSKYAQHRVLNGTFSQGTVQELINWIITKTSLADFGITAGYTVTEDAFISSRSGGTPINVGAATCIGFKFQVGTTDRYVTQLGRWKIAGNSQVHTLRIMDGANSTLASVTVDLSVGSADTFVYATLAKPITLRAGQVYWIFSSESAVGDTFYDDDQTVNLSGIGTILESSYELSCGADIATNNIGSKALGPLDFKSKLGPIVPTTIFSNEYAFDAMNRLITDANKLPWQITLLKTLSYGYPGSYAAPAFPNDPGGHVGDIKVRRDFSKYANRVILRCGANRGNFFYNRQILTDQVTEVVAGGYKAYTFQYPVTDDIETTWPAVLIYDGAAIGGIGWGPPDGAHVVQWWWDYANHRLIYDEGTFGALASGHTIDTNGMMVKVPFPVVVNDLAGQNQYSVREYAEDAPDVPDYDTGVSQASGLLAAKSFVPATIDYDILLDNSAVGGLVALPMFFPYMSMLVVDSVRALNDLFRITMVRLTQTPENVLMCHITANNNPSALPRPWQRNV